MEGYWQHQSDKRWVSVETVATLVANPLDPTVAIPAVAGHVVYKPRVTYGTDDTSDHRQPSTTNATLDCSLQELGFMLWLGGFRRVT